MTDWLTAHAEDIAFYVLMCGLTGYALTHPGVIYRKLLRMLAEEIKAAADLWSPAFDLFMVVVPKVWNVVLGVMTTAHRELDRAGTPLRFRPSPTAKAIRTVRRKLDDEHGRENYYHLLRPVEEI